MVSSCSCSTTLLRHLRYFCSSCHIRLHRLLLTPFSLLHNNSSIAAQWMSEKGNDDLRKIKDMAELSVGLLLNVGAPASVMFFWKIFMFSLFKVTKSPPKAFSKVCTIVSCSKYYQNDFCYYEAKTPQRETLASDNLALPLIFFNLLGWNLSEFSKFVKIVLPIITKPEKRGYKGSFLAILKKIFISDEAMARNIWDIL